MAVLDFVASPSDTSPVLEVNRGDIGNVLDVQAAQAVSKFFLIVPDQAFVLLDTKYGNQGVSLTGELVTSGGGPTYYSY